MATNAFSTTGSTTTANSTLTGLPTKPLTIQPTISQALTQGLSNGALKPMNTSTTSGVVSQPKIAQTTPSTTGAITNLDNVNHTYMQNGQNYGLKADGSGYELKTAPTTSTSTSTSLTPTYTAPTPTAPVNVNTTYPGLIQALANKSNPNAEYQAAQDEAKRVSDQAVANSADYAHKTNNIAGTAGFLTQQTGLQGQLNNQFNTVQGALANQYQGATNRISAANTQQATQQSALNQAAGLAAPVTGVSYGTQVYNPQTNSFTSGGSAFQGGQVAGEQALGQQYAQNVSANNQAMAVKNQVMSFLNTTPINPSQFTDLNSVIGLLSGKVSDPKYTQLSAQLTEYLNTLAPILGVGGDTTNLKTQIAQSMLDGRMQPAAIAQVLNTIEQTAATKLKQQQYGGGTQTNNQTTTPSSSNIYSW